MLPRDQGNESHLAKELNEILVKFDRAPLATIQSSLNKLILVFQSATLIHTESSRQIQNEFSELQVRREEKAEAEKHLNEYNDVIRQKSDAIGRIDPLIDTADKVLKTVEDAFALANMAAGKDLDKLRTHLEVGCMCPLCRQKIEHELPQRSDLVDECNALKEQKGSAQKNLDELRDRRNTLVRQKTTAEEMCKQVRYSLEKTKADIETRQKAIDRAVSNLQIETGDIATIDAIIKTTCTTK